MKDILLNVYLVGVELTLVLSCFLQLIRKYNLADLGGPWKYAKGWQNDIAFWNLGLLIIIAISIATQNTIMMIGICIGVIVMIACFGRNHDKLASTQWHKAMAKLHLFGVITGLFAVLTQAFT